MTLFDAGCADDIHGMRLKFLMLVELKIPLMCFADHLSRCVSKMAAWTLS
jgi:hypothetical protein